MTDFPFDVNRVAAICRENDIEMLGVFGSVARREQTPESDLDLLVRFSKRKSLLSVIALERKLADVVGRHVDLLTEAAISPHLRDRILSQLEVVYEA